MNKRLTKLGLSQELLDICEKSPNVVVPTTKDELIKLTFGSYNADAIQVAYEVNGKMVPEATVTRCKNGVVVNFTEDYMRRRDPNCMVITDEGPTDKPRFADRYPDMKWDTVRKETLDWLASEELIVMPFLSGGSRSGYDSILVCPLSSACFATGLADLQAFVNVDELDREFNPRAVIYLAPPFRHTHFDGKQIVAHNRLNGMHEVFSYNLYPGPSAKKGVYSILLTIGEEEGWITTHTSAVRVITPYENETVIMHEGASGGGKSEMLEQIHKDDEGKLVLATNTITGETYKLNVTESCKLMPICDDMATCHPSIQNDSGKLVITDGEEGWFLRVNHIDKYGTDLTYEKISIHPPEPLVFFNMQGAPNSTCLIWEHTLDSNGKPCPNPRVIIPRRFIPGIESEPVEVDVRSFGVRMPPSTSENPNYGIMGLMQVVPPALAWLWRLVSPRGHNNPSIVDTKGMSGEGVGSYWPFATGLKIKQANLLLNQIKNAPNTNYVLIPNQHIGVYEVGFAPEWVAREFLARVGTGKIKERHLVPARCSLFGYSMEKLQIDGQYIRQSFLQPETQTRLGFDGYDAGAEILINFFKQELEQFRTDELDPLGQQIIDCFFNNGTVEDYAALM
ncbi:MAG: DUF4914 family protein [Clostridia bacterium]